MTIRLCHMSDIHIFSYKYHKEFQQILDDLEQKLCQDNPDYTVVCGDVAHNKLNVSNEYYENLAKFFQILSNGTKNSISLILGNHDLNLANLSRVDSISPIVKYYPKIFLHKKSGYKLISEKEKLVFGIFSIIDRLNWPIQGRKINPDGMNIALYHGPIKQAKFDNNVTINEGEDLNLFRNYDFGFFGDIHERQFLDPEKRFAYPGNFYQKNYGESPQKGYLLWQIEDKNNFSTEFRELINPKPFYTISLQPDLIVPGNLDIKPKARLRVLAPKELNFLEEQEVRNEVVRLYQPDNSPAIIGKQQKSNNAFLINENVIQLENLRDLTVQEQLFQSFFKEKPEITSEVLQEIFRLNRGYQERVVLDEDVRRNVLWSVDSFEFSNFFSFGENNCLNFGQYSGLVGIVGPNKIGKSSVIDTLLIALSNEDSKSKDKGDRVKAIEYINENKEKAQVKLILDIMGEKYQIVRTIEKVFLGKRKGKLSENSKVSVDFKKLGQEDLTGEQRPDTDKIIRRNFGTIDDLISTSISPQDEFSRFLKFGGLKRKEILARCLDLKIFEEKYQLADEDFKIIKNQLKDFTEDYPTLLAQVENEIILTKTLLENEKEREAPKQEIKPNVALKKQLLEQLHRKTKVLTTIPCGDQYPTCPFIQDAFQARNKIPQLKDEINQLKDQNKKEENIQFDRVIEHSKKLGWLEQKQRDLQQKYQSYQKLRKEYEVYKLYLEALSRDGLPYQIIASKLPIINQEINNLLVNMVKFKVWLQDNFEDKTLSIYIQYPKYKPRKIEFASGMEKFISSLAIRTAILRVMNLPKANFMIIDEGFGSLDEKQRDEVYYVLNYMKRFFKAIFIISHQNDMKDMCDHLIEITQDKDGYSKIEA